MKVVGRVFDNRIWQQVKISDIHCGCGYMRVRGTTDTIFVVKHLHDKGKECLFWFCFLEKYLIGYF